MGRATLPSYTLMRQCSLSLSHHSGQEYKTQIALCLTHSESLSESRKAKKYLSISFLRIKQSNRCFDCVAAACFQADFVPSLAQRLNAKMASKKHALIQDALLLIHLLEKHDECSGGTGAKRNVFNPKLWCMYINHNWHWQSLQPCLQMKLLLDNSTKKSHSLKCLCNSNKQTSNHEVLIYQLLT